MSVFGTILLPTDVEDAITALLKQWMDTYLREMDRVTDRDPPKLPTVKTWGLGDLDDRLGEQDITPAVFVECAEAEMTGEADTYSADWEMTIAVVCQSQRSMRRARELAQIYYTNAALICVQQGLPGWDFDWTGQSTGVLDAQTRRYKARGEARFVLHVPDVVARDIGPIEPGDDPPEYPTALTVETSVNPDD